MVLTMCKQHTGAAVLPPETAGQTCVATHLQIHGPQHAADGMGHELGTGGEGVMMDARHLLHVAPCCVEELRPPEAIIMAGTLPKQQRLQGLQPCHNERRLVLRPATEKLWALAHSASTARTCSWDRAVRNV